jgi:hypothetical protein
MKYILLLTTIFSFGSSNTTVCFKNGHVDLTISDRMESIYKYLQKINKK